MMEHKVALLYRNALAQYAVTLKKEGWYEARLLKYGKRSPDQPPAEIRFYCEGRHCSGTTTEQDLMDDLYHAVQP